jgi:predicted ATPase/DNA-binding XRE family transcriptional regulator
VNAPQSFGEWLRHRRRELDLTQDALARQVGCARVTIRKLEANEMRPSKQLAELLAEQLGVPPAERETFVRFGRGGLPAGLETTTPRHNLPTNPSSFIGREHELAAVEQMLKRSRLVTLTGSGGIGKTRLALQAAGELLDAYPDGVWWVELAALRDPALVVQAVAKVREVREIPNQPLVETLADALCAQQLLLVLDNCEHLISACAQLADRLLGACQNLTILTTSREALDILGETIWPVPSLSLPDQQESGSVKALSKFESIRLFTDRAMSVQSKFELVDQNAPTVVQICRRLSGIPLAIELAATRVKMMSVDEIAKRLNDRFDLLTAGSRTALPRHQTLRATMDWSFDLLSEPERMLFRRLSVFAGGFTLKAAEAVAAGGLVSKSQVVDLVGQLINKSLVTVEERSGDTEGETRYRMLETVREYARQKLEEAGETDRLCQRHRDFFITFAEQAGPKLKGAEQFEWLDRLEVEYDNWRSAWDCAIESDIELALRLASVLIDFWLMRGNPSEDRGWLAILLPRTNEWGNTAKRACALSVAGYVACLQADFAAARPLLEEALRIARISGDKKEIAFALLWLGWTALRQRDDRAAQSCTEECLAIYQELQDQSGIAVAMFFLGDVAAADGHYAEAEGRYLKSLAKFQELGDKFRAGPLLNSLGELARLQGDYERAGTFYEQYLEILRELRSRFTLATPLFNLAWVSLHGGDDRKAKALFGESLELSKEYGDKNGLAIGLAGFASVLEMTGKPEQAARLFGAVESLLEGIGMAGRMDPSDQKEFAHYVAAARGQLDEAAFAKAWAQGRAMPLEQAVEFALQS